MCWCVATQYLSLENRQLQQDKDRLSQQVLMLQQQANDCNTKVGFLISSRHDLLVGCDEPRQNLHPSSVVISLWIGVDLNANVSKSWKWTFFKLYFFRSARVYPQLLIGDLPQTSFMLMTHLPETRAGIQRRKLVLDSSASFWRELQQNLR